MKGIGILPTFRPSHIDHLVPLCQILDIPLLTTDPCVKEIIEIYYPPMEIHLAAPEDYCLDEALKDYDFFVYAEHFRLASGAFQFADYGTRRRARSVFTMHGNSDKWRDIFWMEKLADEDIVLLYGPQMVDYMHEKGVSKRPILTGNYRYEYYLANQSFFDLKLNFPKDKKTILYAPTWVAKKCLTDMHLDFSSFFNAHRFVFENCPDHYQLIVKLHPNMSFLAYDEIESLKKTYPHLLFLNECPLIYPLLNQIDIYIGDYSSIGYDFLAFNRPLFFLNERSQTYVHHCGVTVNPKDFSRIYQLIENNVDNFEQMRKEAYDYAFSNALGLKELKNEVMRACTSIF